MRESRRRDEMYNAISVSLVHSHECILSVVTTKVPDSFIQHMAHDELSAVKTSFAYFSSKSATTVFAADPTKSPTHSLNIQDNYSTHPAVLQPASYSQLAESRISSLACSTSPEVGAQTQWSAARCSLLCNATTKCLASSLESIDLKARLVIRTRSLQLTAKAGARGSFWLRVWVFRRFSLLTAS